MKPERMYRVLIGPHVSEKSTLVYDNHRQVVFRVVKDATKFEIKKAVEALFKVQVESVQVLNQKGKTKRTVRGVGRRSGLRKAYVNLVEGHEIDFVEQA